MAGRAILVCFCILESNAERPSDVIWARGRGGPFSEISSPGGGSWWYPFSESTEPTTGNTVKLLVSRFTVLSVVLQAEVYHTSVQIGDEEWFYDALTGGIQSSAPFESHLRQGLLPNVEKFVHIDVYTTGVSSKKGEDLEANVKSYFPDGGYDLIRRNCNHFSDAALWYLLQKRLSDIGDFNSVANDVDADQYDSLRGLADLAGVGQVLFSDEAADFNMSRFVDDVSGSAPLTETCKTNCPKTTVRKRVHFEEPGKRAPIRSSGKRTTALDLD